MTIFRERLGLARKALEAAEPQGRESPLWYWVALIVAGSSGQPAQVPLSALYEEAATRFPHYHSIHATAHQLPPAAVGGRFRPGWTRSCARLSSARAEKDGEAFYAWLYLDVARKIDGDDPSVTRATWPLMKKGFEDMLARYPDATNRNLFATHACRARTRRPPRSCSASWGLPLSLGEDSPGITTGSRAAGSRSKGPEGGARRARRYNGASSLSPLAPR